MLRPQAFTEHFTFRGVWHVSLFRAFLWLKISLGVFFMIWALPRVESC